MSPHLKENISENKYYLEWSVSYVQFSILFCLRFIFVSKDYFQHQS